MAFWSLPSLFRASSKRRALIVDIGSSSVGAAVTLLSPGTAPKVLSSARTSIAPGTELNFHRFVKLMWKALDATVLDTLRFFSERPTEIHCFFASPWYASQLRTASVEKDKEFTFDTALYDRLLKKESGAFIDEKAKEYAHTKEKVVFIERTPVDIKLNGYRPDAPLGKKVKSAEVSFFMGAAPETVLEQAKEAFAKLVPGAPVTFHSFLLSFFVVARELFPETKDAVLIDVGGEVTDVSIMRDRLLTGSVSFPLGRNFLLRKASKALKKEMEETRSALRLLAEGKLERTARMTLVEALRPVQEEWLIAFREALERVVGAGLLPHNVLLFAESDAVKWFIDAIEKEEYGQYTLSSAPFEVTVVGAALLGNNVSFSATIGMRDQFLGIESVFAGKAHAKLF